MRPCRQEMTDLQSGAAKRVQIVNEIANYLRTYPNLPASEMIGYICIDYGAIPSKAREYYQDALRVVKNRARPCINPGFVIEIPDTSRPVIDRAAAITDGLEKRRRHAPKPEPEPVPDTAIWINPEARKRKPKTRVEVQKDLTLEPCAAEKKPPRSKKEPYEIKKRQVKQKGVKT